MLGQSGRHTVRHGAHVGCLQGTWTAWTAVSTEQANLPEQRRLRAGEEPCGGGELSMPPCSALRAWLCSPRAGICQGGRLERDRVCQLEDPLNTWACDVAPAPLEELREGGQPGWPPPRPTGPPPRCQHRTQTPSRTLFPGLRSPQCSDGAEAALPDLLRSTVGQACLRRTHHPKGLLN